MRSDARTPTSTRAIERACPDWRAASSTMWTGRSERFSIHLDDPPSSGHGVTENLQRRGAAGLLTLRGARMQQHRTELVGGQGTVPDSPAGDEPQRQRADGGHQT